MAHGFFKADIIKSTVMPEDYRDVLYCKTTLKTMSSMINHLFTMSMSAKELQQKEFLEMVSIWLGVRILEKITIALLRWNQIEFVSLKVLKVIHHNN